jgi:hypothetical protein
MKKKKITEEIEEKEPHIKHKPNSSRDDAIVPVEEQSTISDSSQEIEPLNDTLKTSVEKKKTLTKKHNKQNPTPNDEIIPLEEQSDPLSSRAY